ncbi:hypothetical protein BX661DRAFT_177487 [Kickxella alabastrina]|uniref:uncharacterized protein n=1 Tax=Kickxella alabastrina TaxID=61397 RepID=UPI002220A4A0|nr:uncharacterized protein BX661DRAFT_177487 [Kickxella alabastrina]KAI7833758.1 hypothetical protein BX661DRAFT_177487 [Kickxella alabastrina]
MPPARKSNKLSRKELQQLKEYGQLDPLGAMGADNELDELISKAMSKSGRGRFTGIMPSEEDAAKITVRRPTMAAQKTAIVSDDEQEDDESESENAEIETADASEDEEMVSGSDEEASGGSEDESNEQSSDEKYEVDEIDNTGVESDSDIDMEEDAHKDALKKDDSEIKEVYEAHDFMAGHFADDDSALMHQKLAAVTQKEYKQVAIEDPVLGSAVLYDIADGGLKQPNPKPLKQKLVKPFHRLNKRDDFTEFQRGLFNWFDQYRDVVYADRTFEKDDEITTAYAVHAMNHVVKSRDRERKNNAKLSKAHAAGTDAGELRDRGFTRPRVLIITPFRNTAHKIVQKILRLASADQEMNLSRLAKEYGTGEDEETENSAHKRKPTFAGNIDDSFRIGVQLHHNTVKLYSEFYRSDIIVASPIGLRMTTGAESGDRKDFDFLSSIEVAIVDQCDVLLMQNWDHVSHIFEHMNLTPKKDHGCDFSRVRNWYLEGTAQYRRQTIMISEYMTPEIQAIFNNNCRSIEGKVRFKPIYPGAIADVVAQVPQIFKRVAARRLMSAADDRFAHFTENVLPELTRSAATDKHTLIFASSYFDFVRIRNYCRARSFSFAAISEYSTRSEAMSARVDFYKGDLQFILYSERAHFYHRYPIKGIHHMVFYSLPDHPLYYSELVNLMLTSNDETASSAKLTCTAFYTKYDQLKIERVVGSRLVSQLLTGERSQYTFA